MKKYRRIIKSNNSQPQSYQVSLVAFVVIVVISFSFWYLSQVVSIIKSLLTIPIIISTFLLIISFIIFLYYYFNREQVSIFKLEKMSRQGKKLSKDLKKLLNDKVITDVLKLSNCTRFGEEMPEIEVFVNDDMLEGFVECRA